MSQKDETVQGSGGGADIGPYTYDEFLTQVKNFHGHVAPGMIIGGFMVDTALKNLPPGELFDALCETRTCLPDAVQLLTPCTIGNGWLKVINLGRYAATLYEKSGGQGIRVWVDAEKIKAWPEVHSWFFKLKPKKEQDFERLMDEIRRAGADYFSMRAVRMAPDFLQVKRRKGFLVCPLCRESYPMDDGAICRGCQGDVPYLQDDSQAAPPAERELTAAPVEAAVGKHALSDMTRIIPGREKGPAFRKGQQLAAGDVCRLQHIGRLRVYTREDNPDHPDWVHEDDAAVDFARAMAGEGVVCPDPPREGKMNFQAAHDGLLVTDALRLEQFNMLPGVICAARQNYSLVGKDRKFAGTRAIPLYLPRADYLKAMSLLSDGPLFSIVPLKPARVGILVTGTEVFRGLVEDKFIPIITNKVKKLGSCVVDQIIVPDDRQAIREGIERLIAAGADLIVTTAGLSVDPDDLTRKGLEDAGIQDSLYGAPILPGAMTLLARIGKVRVFGVPACALYFKTTSLDLLLPRLLAGLTITRQDLARMADGSFCLECKKCTYPKCPFGK